MKTDGHRKAFKKGIQPIRILPIGYFLIALAGAILLSLPIASRGAPLPFFRALFTSVSASCVTGLIVADTGTDFTLFGQTVIIVLIQLGGLGFMTLATMLFGAAKRNISLKNRMVAAEALGEDGINDMLSLCVRAAKYTFGIEGAGAALLAIRFVPELGAARGVWYSVFHSISAFCNAGFDLVGGYRSFVPYYDDPLVLITLMALIVSGGLGFVVLGELTAKKRKPSGFSLHAKLVLVSTVALLLLGFIMTLALEWSNPQTLAPMSIPKKLLSALFQTVTLRTAGFNTIDQAALTDATKFFSTVLMVIGGAPAGTAGGIKVTTVAVLILTVRSFVRSESDIVAFGRTIGIEAARKAVAISVLAVALLTFSSAAVSIAEGASFAFIDCMFECASALGTVGISCGVTGTASAFSLTLLALLMFIGRAGILTLALAMGNKRDKALIRYPGGNVMIG